MGDVEYRVIGGRRYCPCSVAVLEMAEDGFRKAGKLPGNVSIYDRVTQAGYRGAATVASRGSHDRGGVVDTWYSLVDTDEDQRIWDQAGAVGCRRRSWEFTSTNTPDHGHIIVVGCPHLAEFAADQLAEIRKGGDGMAGSRPFAGPKPSFTPWRTRYAAFTAQQSQEEDMPLSDADISRIVTAVRATNITANGRKAGLADHLAWSFVDGKTALQGIAAVSTQIKAVAEKVGATIDTEALVAGVVAGILPDLIAALSLAAGAEGLSEEQVGRIATATADELAKRVAA